MADSVLASLLGVEWLWKRILRPMDRSAPHYQAVVSTLDEVVEVYTHLDRELAQGMTLVEAARRFVTPEQVTKWVRTLVDGDTSRVLLGGYPRTRLRILVRLLPTSMSSLAYWAWATAQPDDRFELFQLWRRWNELTRELDTRPRRRISKQYAEIAESEALRATEQTPAELDAYLQEFPAPTDDFVTKLRITARSSVLSELQLAHQLRRDLIRAEALRPER